MHEALDYLPGINNLMKLVQEHEEALELIRGLKEVREDDKKFISYLLSENAGLESEIISLRSELSSARREITRLEKMYYEDSR